jgi:glycolate oxidase iron-sulfur subunit
LAKANIAAFENAKADYVCTNAAGCGAMMKDYGHLLADDPDWKERAAAIVSRVRDVSELLSAAGPARSGGSLPVRVAYDAPCHLLHAQRVSAPPLDVLRAIPDLELVPLNESEVCCGSAGIYNLVQPAAAAELGQRKAANVAMTGAKAYVSANPGCLVQVSNYLRKSGWRLPALHPVELLDASIQGVSAGRLFAGARR